MFVSESIGFASAVFVVEIAADIDEGGDEIDVFVCIVADDGDDVGEFGDFGV